MDFALIGAAGYIAPRHIEAIRQTGHRLRAATDPLISSKVKLFPEDTALFDNQARFEKYVRQHNIDYVSICSPNHLHKEHILLALKYGAHAICEKPVVLDPKELDELAIAERQYNQRIYTVLQLREHPSLLSLQGSFSPKDYHDVVVTCVTPRGPQYDSTWKGFPEYSGGIGFNIGVHLFDLVLWLFGDLVDYEVHLQESKTMAGHLKLTNAQVRWFLSTEEENLSLCGTSSPERRISAYRELSIDGVSIEFDGGGDLHTRVYRKILSGVGAGIGDARPSIELAHKIRMAPVVARETMEPHPFIYNSRRLS